ncbi:PREDICTED: piggyBac transposable element-derived protein 4-like [Dinoponera quadriceps]|uniref:PiggyBac transposable element-derived protein 4-like n=1 Tax=Dinoponera quadriceps TaxID=609295 RepID=A0A6P3Y815_DINQU|nr:PREDICTED: piggyBac transposable element-derived protein 4-like [Dinoponera quadriceps]
MNEYAEEEEILIHNFDCDNPVSLYKLFVTDHILEIIAEETNKYATQSINNSACNSTSHQRAWEPITKDKINTFFGILLIMGIVKVPDIRLYWSQNDIYANARIKNAMKRDRFIFILKYLHFSDNTTARTEDRLYKIRNVFEAIVHTFKSTIKPGKNIVIDESMIPWRGRLIFRQYIPGKRHKYGIKAYKLCLPEGYTYNMEIYAGKNAEPIAKTHSHDVVIKLIRDLLFEGRILFTDSFYTSIPLAEELLQKKTFICGTIKKNKKHLPPQSKQKQVRGSIISFENHKGVKFMKWTDKRPLSWKNTKMVQKSYDRNNMRNMPGKCMVYPQKMGN